MGSLPATPAAGGNAQVPASSDAPAFPFPDDSPPNPLATDSELVDLGSLLTATSNTEYQVWMVQKNNLDHGPFSGRELGQQIYGDQVRGDDMVLNMDTGVRQKCHQWQEFAEIVQKAREKRRQEQEAAAIKKMETVERRVGWLPYIIAGGVVLFIGISVGSYFIYRSATRDRRDLSADEFADLVAAGERSIKTGGGILPIERSGKNRRRRGGRRGGGGAGGLSAEEAMAQGVEYGDLSGGMTQLSVGQINSVMNRNARRFYPCLAGHTGRVSLDFVINGDGSVAGVSVPGAGGTLSSCMSGRMRGIRFPSFGAPRMRASFFFEVGP
jgi:hypothetical protein